MMNGNYVAKSRASTLCGEIESWEVLEKCFVRLSRYSEVIIYNKLVAAFFVRPTDPYVEFWRPQGSFTPGEEDSRPGFSRLGPNEHHCKIDKYDVFVRPYISGCYADDPWPDPIAVDPYIIGAVPMISIDVSS